MELTPLDVRYQEFRKGLGGYQVAEVRDFLGQVADHLSRLEEASAAQRSRIQVLEAELQTIRTDETGLREALRTAERMAQELRSQAQQEAEAVLREVASTRERALKELVTEMRQLKAQIDQLRSEKQAFREQLQGLIDQHQKLLQAE
jgi:cell division initiation protein